MSSALSRIQGVIAARRAERRGRPRRRAKTTREGKLFALVTFGVGIAAVNTGNNLLYLMLGLMLSLLLLSMVLSEIALKRVFVTRRLPERAWARTPTLVELVLSNEKRLLPSYSLEVEDRAEDEPSDRRCYFLKIAPQGEQTAAYRRIPSRRGRMRLVGYRVGTRYPFGLIEKAYLHEGEGELLVYPELVDVASAEIRGLLDGMDHPDPLIGRGTEVAGLREYVSGDEARSIHWRRTATLGSLVVRERHRDASSRVTLVLDNARPEGADAAWDVGFEGAISRAASLAAEALTRGAAVSVVVRGAESPLVAPGSAPDPIWRFLAELEPSAEGAPPPEERRGSLVVPVVPAAPEPEGGAT